jgi:DNA modification methylase
MQMKPAIEIAGARVFLGDCRDVLKTLPDNSVDSIVTDPPYELGFMGKKWDSSGIAYDVTVWAECLRVLKPGGHVLAFGGSRTWHRLAVAVEDAGFELRDSIAWIYGSGFPKSLDVSKAIDKKLGAEREVIATGYAYGMSKGQQAAGYRPADYESKQLSNEAITPEAKAWQGWGTALKPAFEPVVVGRKPFGKGVTVAENVLQWGVGGLNIDGSRIGNNGGTRDSDFDETSNRGRVAYNMAKGGGSELHVGKTEQLNQGRWPANVILDEVSAGLLDEQSGVLKSGAHNGKSVYSEGSTKTPSSFVQGMAGKVRNRTTPANEGGASRFFMVADTLEHDRMSLCKHTNANNVATLLKTIRATIESSAPTNVEDSQKELNAQLVKSAGIQCDSCATHIAADLVALKTLASSAESLPLFHRSISDLGSSILTQSLVSLVEQWVSTDTIPTMTDFSTLFGCVLLATDELTKPVSLESDKGLSRFIYQAKASKRDRNEGLEDLETRLVEIGDERPSGSSWERRDKKQTTPRQNFHPTVKPTQLMRYLIKLVTPAGGTVLDPFTGSGSTGKAALLDGYGFIGAELTEEYLPIIENRLRWASEQKGEDDDTLF